jgi:hypothetical protein
MRNLLYEAIIRKCDELNASEAFLVEKPLFIHLVKDELSEFSKGRRANKVLNEWIGSNAKNVPRELAIGLAAKQFVDAAYLELREFCSRWTREKVRKNELLYRRYCKPYSQDLHRIIDLERKCVVLQHPIKKRPPRAKLF